VSCVTNRSSSFTSTDPDDDLMMLPHVAAPHDTRFARPSGTQEKNSGAALEFVFLPFAVSRRCDHRGNKIVIVTVSQT
jgi:hypothetical protein